MTPQTRAAPFRCATAARERTDPQLGTAPQARRWLLIEHRGPWQVDALAGSGIAPDIAQLIGRTSAAAGARPLLIRRPGRSDPGRPRAWAVAYGRGVTVWGSWSVDDDLVAATEALAAPTPSATASADPLLLVCTHGVHDACCALRGRPVAAALAAEWPAQTWECSHVGGDRFAANIVLLPDGVYYGNLEPASAVQTVRNHLRGEVAVGHLRGMTLVPPPAQVAIGAVHDRFGPLAAGDVTVTRSEQSSPGVWEIELAVPVAQLTAIHVTVTSARREPSQLTCRAGAATPATQYRVEQLTVG